MEHGNWQCEKDFIKVFLAEYEIIGELHGGSAAKLFILLDSAAKKFVIKICILEGVDNGRSKLIGEIQYILSEIGREFSKFPSIIRHYYDKSIAWYLMPYYEHYILLRDLLLEDKDYKDKLKTIISDVFDCFYIKAKQTIPNDFMYLRNIQRVLSRLKLASELDQKFQYLNSSFIINDKKMKSIESIFDAILYSKKMLNILSPLFTSYTHDDLTIENILLNRNDLNDFVILDPRGISDTGNYREYVYDLSKLSCTLGGFTTIKYGDFSIILEESNNYKINLNNVTQLKYEKYYLLFLNIVEDNIKNKIPEDLYALERLNFTEACHYLADIPCRLYNGDNYDIVHAMYLKGVQKLNEVYTDWRKKDFL